MAVVADASALGLDAVIDAAFAGRAPETEAQFSKAVAAGTSSGTILSWALRYVTQLHKARVTLEAGADNFTVMRSFIPPVNFRRESQVQTALKSWTAAGLQAAMAQLADAMFEVRRTSALANPLAQRALLMVAQQARRNR
jgi:DNA polymerase-3 subunit delta